MIVLDTNVVSELMQSNPNTAVLGWVGRRARLDLHVTAVTEAELRRDAEVLPAGRRRDELQSRVEVMLGGAFAGGILPFDSDAAAIYAVIAARRHAAGNPIAYGDCQIAAIDRSRGMAVATRDVGGFSGCGIEVIDPWQA